MPKLLYPLQFPRRWEQAGRQNCVLLSCNNIWSIEVHLGSIWEEFYVDKPNSYHRDSNRRLSDGKSNHVHPAYPTQDSIKRGPKLRWLSGGFRSKMIMVPGHAVSALIILPRITTKRWRVLRIASFQSPSDILAPHPKVFELELDTQICDLFRLLFRTKLSVKSKKKKLEIFN